MQSTEILELLGRQEEDGRSTKFRVERESSVREMLSALVQSTNSRTSAILCELLARRKAKSAVPELIRRLETDDSRHVKIEAADALGRIGDPAAGDVLYAWSQRTLDDVPFQHNLALALGAVGYKPAIPYLVQRLAHSDSTLRYCAAWALGKLGDASALSGLKSAQTNESDPRVTDALANAIALIHAADGNA